MDQQEEIIAAFYYGMRRANCSVGIVNAKMFIDFPFSFSHHHLLDTQDKI